MAGETRIVRTARDRLPDRVAIGVLTKTFPPGLVDAVIDEAQARELRKRSLPARLTAYFTLAMWLWREHGYEEVLRQLIDGLGWSGAGPDEADGSYLSALRPPRKKDGEPITVRVIEYTVTTRDEHGATTSELFCLATTLLDFQAWPIEEFPALYHERWRVETLLDAVKTDLRGGPDILTRSQSPDGTRQEIWALLCLYQALADLVGDAARHHRVDPDRISFLCARNTARRSVSRIRADFPPHQLNLARERAWQELGRRVHDRPGRSSPRATKRHTHRYPSRGDRPPTRRVEQHHHPAPAESTTSGNALKKRHWA